MAETQSRLSSHHDGQQRRSADHALVLASAVAIPAEPPLLLDDWVHLNANDRVIVRTPDGHTRTGLVDVVANDASVFWLWLEGGGGRTGIHEENGCHVWVVSGEGSGAL